MFVRLRRAVRCGLTSSHSARWRRSRLQVRDHSVHLSGRRCSRVRQGACVGAGPVWVGPAARRSGSHGSVLPRRWRHETGTRLYSTSHRSGCTVGYLSLSVDSLIRPSHSTTFTLNNNISCLWRLTSCALRHRRDVVRANMGIAITHWCALSNLLMYVVVVAMYVQIGADFTKRT